VEIETLYKFHLSYTLPSHAGEESFAPDAMVEQAVGKREMPALWKTH
jgi:hypothetical protein